MTEAFNSILHWLVMEPETVFESINYGQGTYIYGAGDLGILALQYCEACNIPVLGFIDKFSSNSLVSPSGKIYPIFRPDSCAKKIDKNKCIAVAIATQPFHPIKGNLQGFGWENVIPFYHLTSASLDGHPLKNGWRLGHVSDEEIGIAREVFALWADDQSRLQYEAFIAFHRNYTEIDLSDSPILVSERYVIGEVVKALKGRSNQFVDIGAHVGGAIRKMNDAAITFSDYVLFEPDSISRSSLKADLANLIPSGARSTIQTKILTKSKQRVKFQQGLGYCSQIWENANCYLDAYSLDDFNLNPDFLKVHTEGTEAEILLGAKETIKRSRPVISYSVYHRREGFFSDIFSVMSETHGYHWFFRLHNFQGTGAFVYGIPK
jgi:FkbM family methyltransferase